MLPDQPSGSWQQPYAVTGGVPDWAFDRTTGCIYLVLVLVLAFTPLFPANFVIGIVAFVAVHRERQSRGLPAFWWPFGVFMAGPFVYIFFVYRRDHHGTRVQVQQTYATVPSAPSTSHPPPNTPRS
jgi:hypothetical protein